MWNSVSGRQTCIRGGFALLMLVIALAIGLIIYMMMLRAVMPGVGEGGREQVRVWDEEWRLDPESPERKKAAKKTAKYLSLKPPITEELKLQGDVRLDNEDRGKIKLVFAPDGKVKGTWEAKYKHGDIEYEIAAEFAGVTDPTNTFREGEAVRTDLLYFITRGTYSQKSWDSKNERESEQKGVVYAAGWLDGAYQARGEITLTTDKSWAAVYSYSAAR